MTRPGPLAEALQICENAIRNTNNVEIVRTEQAAWRRKQQSWLLPAL